LEGKRPGPLYLPDSSWPLVHQQIHQREYLR